VSNPLTSRRTLLTASGGALAALWLGANADDLLGWLQHAERTAESSGPPPLLSLTPEQAADLEAIAAQIIPSDDTPGAREARVIEFIDYALAHWASPRLPALLEGLAALHADLEARWPDSGRFAALDSERQIELLQAWEAVKSPAFEIARSLTIAGMFSSPEHRGNRDEIGWRLLGFESRHAWQPPFGAYDGERSQEPDPET
jgi:gluconate 2-dehydrogenase gamma chain